MQREVRLGVLVVLLQAPPTAELLMLVGLGLQSTPQTRLGEVQGVELLLVGWREGGMHAWLLRESLRTTIDRDQAAGYTFMFQLVTLLLATLAFSRMERSIFESREVFRQNART